MVGHACNLRKCKEEDQEFKVILSNIMKLRQPGIYETLSKSHLPPNKTKQTPGKQTLSLTVTSLFVLVSSLGMKLKVAHLTWKCEQKVWPIKKHYHIHERNRHYLQTATVVLFWKLNPLNCNTSSSRYWPGRPQQYPFFLSALVFLTMK